MDPYLPKGWPIFFEDDDIHAATAYVQAAETFCNDSDDEEEEEQVESRQYIERNREMGHERLVADYFCNEPTYTSQQFRRRFRMRRSLFERIVESVKGVDPFFQEKLDCTGRASLSALQKCTAAMRMLAYGCAADFIDEYIRIGATTSMDCIRHFITAIHSCFSAQYLRSPTREDLERLLAFRESRGFFGMLGSVDCMHWEWKNCPVAWQDQFKRGDHRKPSLMLEAVASADTWIWHAFFGMPGANNDINVLWHSPLLNELHTGIAPQVQFMVNGNSYDMGYYLADGIYPDWHVFMKSIRLPQAPKDRLFSQFQESARKDIERTFGILKIQFQILTMSARVWDRKTLRDIMYACIIMHNMIVEDEGHIISPDNVENEYDRCSTVQPPEIYGNIHLNMQRYYQRVESSRDNKIHRRLKNDLVEHIWRNFR